MAKPIMAKATAVWLVDNTTITFKQIADFVEMHELEVQGIADGDVAAGVKGFDPITNNQLTQEEIVSAQADPLYKLVLKFNSSAVGEEKRRGPRYTPLSKRQDRPASILWLVKFHPEFTDGQISKLVGTTKPTIQAIRERTHWNITNITPIDPVALALSLGASFVGKGFSGDKQQLVPLIKAGLSHKGFALLDVISPCVTFNDHQGSTKSYQYTRDHVQEVVETDFVPVLHEITA